MEATIWGLGFGLRLRILDAAFGFRVEGWFFVFRV